MDTNEGEVKEAGCSPTETMAGILEGVGESTAPLPPHSSAEIRDITPLDLQQPQPSTSAETIPNTKTLIVRIEPMSAGLVHSTLTDLSTGTSAGISNSWLITFIVKTSKPISAATREKLSSAFLETTLPSLWRSILATTSTVTTADTETIEKSTTVNRTRLEGTPEGSSMMETSADTSLGFRDTWRVDFETRVSEPVSIATSEIIANQIITQTRIALRQQYSAVSSTRASTSHSISHVEIEVIGETLAEVEQEPMDETPAASADISAGTSTDPPTCTRRWSVTTMSPSLQSLLTTSEEDEPMETSDSMADFEPVLKELAQRTADPSCIAAGGEGPSTLSTPSSGAHLSELTSWELTTSSNGHITEITEEEAYQMTDFEVRMQEEAELERRAPHGPVEE